MSCLTPDEKIWEITAGAARGPLSSQVGTILYVTVGLYTRADNRTTLLLHSISVLHCFEYAWKDSKCKMSGVHPLVRDLYKRWVGIVFFRCSMIDAWYKYYARQTKHTRPYYAICHALHSLMSHYRYKQINQSNHRRQRLSPSRWTWLCPKKMEGGIAWFWKLPTIRGQNTRDWKRKWANYSKVCG